MSRKGTPYSSRPPSRSPSSERIRGRHLTRSLQTSPKLRHRHKSRTPSPRSRSRSRSRSHTGSHRSPSSSVDRNTRRCCRSLSRSRSRPRSLSLCRRCCRCTKCCKCIRTCCLCISFRRLCRRRRQKSIPAPTPPRSKRPISRPKPLTPAIVPRRRRWRIPLMRWFRKKKKSVIMCKK